MVTENKKARELSSRVSFAGVPGLEPRMDEPESPVLPITPHPNGMFQRFTVAPSCKGNAEALVPPSGFEPLFAP